MSIKLNRADPDNPDFGNIIVDFDFKKAFLISEEGFNTMSIENAFGDRDFKGAYIVELENFPDRIRNCFNDISVFSWISDYEGNIFYYLTAFYHFEKIGRKMFMRELNLDELKLKVEEIKNQIEFLKIKFEETLSDMGTECRRNTEKVSHEVYSLDVRNSFDDWRNGKDDKPEFDPTSITHYAEKCSRIVEDFMGEVSDMKQLIGRINKVIEMRS